MADVVDLIPNRIAFIIDGVVQDVVNCDARIAAIFLSNPTTIDVTNLEDSDKITVDWTHDSNLNTFTAPIFFAPSGELPEN